MKTEDFDYDLPKDRIAQHPTDRREDCRMMVMDRFTGELSHEHFYNLKNYLQAGDTLVMNDSKVIPARLFGVRPGTTGAIEVLLLQDLGDGDWKCLVRPGRKMRPGDKIDIGGELLGTVKEIVEEGQRIIHFDYDGIFEEILDRLGEMPTPPYIKEKLKDKNEYQTVYARYDGSAAAPTAGLHFSKPLLKDLEESGINLAYLTLHVGLGTFRPVHEDQVEDHKMHAEYYSISQETADLLNKTRQEGHRIIAVGTTVTRTLESVVQKHGCLQGDSGWTDIFIYPGYEYQAIDGIITNFHLPKSSLIMMISAFTGRDRLLAAYKTAVDMHYRFYSFGDCMLILDRSKEKSQLDQEVSKGGGRP